MTGRASAALLLSAVLAAACQLNPPPVPAVLAHSDAAAMGRLKAALAKAVGRAQVELGPGDPAQSSTLSVLPPRPGAPDDRSLARPTIFRLEIEGQACILVREDTGARIALEGVDCRAATP